MSQSPPAPITTRRRRLLLLASAVGAVGVLVATLLTQFGTHPPASVAPPAPWALQALGSLPPPPPAVVQAQADAAQGQPGALARLDQAMRPYRLAMQPPAAVAAKHAQADALIDNGEAVEAGRALASIIETAPTAPPGQAAESRRILLQDAYFRLCRLALEAGQPVVATLQIDNALALGAADDLFVANLLVLRAAAHTRLGNTPLATNDYDRARRLNQALAVGVQAPHP